MTALHALPAISLILLARDVFSVAQFQIAQTVIRLQGIVLFVLLELTPTPELTAALLARRFPTVSVAMRPQSTAQLATRIISLMGRALAVSSVPRSQTVRTATRPQATARHAMQGISLMEARRAALLAPQ